MKNILGKIIILSKIAGLQAENPSEHYFAGFIQDFLILAEYWRF